MCKKALYTIKNYSTMEEKPFQKRKSLKSLMNKENISDRRFFFLTFFALIGLFCAVNDVNAQAFNCKKDLLDENTVRIPPEASSLIIGQRYEVSVFNDKGRKISRGLKLSSDNEFVGIRDMYFFVEYESNPWNHIDGSLIEIDGNITITADKCNLSYSFPFKTRQAYAFNKDIICKGENREFAIARYKNELGKELMVVMDITNNQLHLLESPISIDASGIKGTDGRPGATGKNGPDGTERSVDGGRGADGGFGGNGGDGENGGNITVYLPYNIDGISVNIEGGEGGRGGSGGSGGRGGEGYKRKTGETTRVLGIKVPKYEKIGKDGIPGNEGRPGNDGRHGRDGNFNRVKVDDIQKYFLNVRQDNFNIDNIDLE